MNKAITYGIAILLGIFTMPFLLGALLQQTDLGFFTAVISGILLLAGGYMLFFWQTRKGLLLLLFSLCLMALSKSDIEWQELSRDERMGGFVLILLVAIIIGVALGRKK